MSHTIIISTVIIMLCFIKIYQTKPVEPIEPTEPIETNEPIGTNESIEPTDPIETTEPIGTTEPTGTTEPIDSEQSESTESPKIKNFKRIEHINQQKYSSFLQKNTYMYLYFGSIAELNNILKSMNIKYIISSSNHIYLCSKNSIDFEIRINKNDNIYTIQFIPISCNELEFINLLEIIIT